MKKTEKSKKSKKTSTAKTDGHVFVKKDLPKKKKTVRKKKEHSTSRSQPKRRVAENKKKHIEEQLKEIYKNSDGSFPDMKHFSTRGKLHLFRAMVLLCLSCVVLGLVAWFGFFMYQPNTTFSEQDVILSISGEEEVGIGEEVRYRVRYVNDQNIALHGASLQVHYPEGFVFKESSISSDSPQNDVWNLQTISGGDSGFIDIYGNLYGNKTEDQSLRVFLTYNPENFSSEFQKVATVAINTATSPVAIKVTASEDVVPGAQTRITINVERRATQDKISHPIALQIQGDGMFIAKSAEPASDQFHDMRWSLEETETEKTITVRGIFLTGAENEGVYTLPIQVLGWKDVAKTGEGYVFEEFVYEPQVTQKEITVTPVINGATSDVTLIPGELLHASVVVKNNGDLPLHNVRVRAVFDTPSFENKSILHWPDLQDEADGFVKGEQINNTTRRGIITWTSQHIPALERVLPGESKTIDFRIPIRNNEQTELSDFSTFAATFVADVLHGKGEATEILSSSPVDITINSDLRFAIRNEIEKKQGTSEHNITWLLENTFHALEDIVIQADVYGDTTFDTSALVVPAGITEFNEEKKQLRWTIETMPISVDVLPLQFVLRQQSINPSQTQLMSKVEVYATDTATNERIILVGDEILL